MFLEIQEIYKHYGKGDSQVSVLNGIDFSLDRGEYCVLLGPSGSGKSTLLNIIGALDPADSGTVQIGGEKLNSLNEKKLTAYRREHLGYIFQMYNLIPDLTVRENVEVGAYLGKNPLPIDELIETLGLTAHQHKRPNQLSGGQQQRCAIGRAMVKNPDLLLCDEPTGALDYQTSKDILKLLDDLNRKYQTTILMVTHNEAFQELADRVIKLRDGSIRKNQVNESRKSVDEIEW